MIGWLVAAAPAAATNSVLEGVVVLHTDYRKIMSLLLERRSYREVVAAVGCSRQTVAAAGRSSELVRLVHPVGTQFRRPGTVARFRVF